MSRIPILALPALAMIVIVVFLIFIPPKSQETTDTTMTVSPTSTEVSETFICTRYNRNEGYTVDCEEQ